MNWVKSGKLKSWNDDVHWLVNWLNVRDLVVRAAATFSWPGACCDCNTRPHCALQMSSAKIAWRDHSRANWLQSVMRSDAHCAWKIGFYRQLDIKSIVVNGFQLKTYPFVCANAAGTWCWECRLANANLTAADLASLDNVLSPCAQIDCWHWMAWYTWIPANIKFFHCRNVDARPGYMQEGLNLQEIAGQIECCSLHISGNV